MSNNKTIDEYAAWAKTKWFGSDETGFGCERDLTVMGFGLSGETGEVMEILKKRVRDNYLDKDHLKKELGDVIYYWANLCNAFGFTPSEVLQSNIDKIEDRHARGVMSGSGNDR